MNRRTMYIQPVSTIFYSCLLILSIITGHAFAETEHPNSTPPAEPAGLVTTVPGLDQEASMQAESLSRAFRAVARQVEPSVVRIIGYTPRGQEMTGSGFVIRSDGYLLTNNHVAEPVDRLYVEFPDGTRYAADVVGTDPLTDLAVLSIPSESLPTLQFTSDDSLAVGDWVMAIGCPLGLDVTVTAGIVSATNRRLGLIHDASRAGYEDFIQTDAAINKGNSGGPLVNLQGQVVGVNSVIVTRTGGSDGLGFAIPEKLARHISNQLIEFGEVRRGFIGIDIQDADPILAKTYGLPNGLSGVLVKVADPELPGGQAGLQPEDIIVTIDNKNTHNADALRNIVAMTEPGTEITIDYYRDGEKHTCQTTLAQMPNRSSDRSDNRVVVRSKETVNRVGFGLADLKDYNGIIVQRVQPGSEADRAGFIESNRFTSSDIIVAVNGRMVSDISEQEPVDPGDWLNSFIEDAEPGTAIRFNVERYARNQKEPTRFITAVEIPAK